MANGKLTISASTVVKVGLDLDRSADVHADPESPFGADARAATPALPEKLAFHFSGSGSALDSVAGDMHLKIYGYEADFSWASNKAPWYDPLMNRALIPLKCSRLSLSVGDYQSKFIKLKGAAGITWSAWGLPLAMIDVNNPPAADGIGFTVVKCAGGLGTKWHGLQGGHVNLKNPYVMCGQGWINVSDLQAGNKGCRQEYRLWKDAVNPFGTSVRLQYTDAFPFVYSCLANGGEAMLATANANPLLDRPVTASGLPFDIHSKSSMLVLAVSKAFRIIYLYDDNILFENASPNDLLGLKLQPLSLALRNAMFKVTPVNGCLLFGDL